MEMVGLDGFGVGFFAALIRVMAIGHDLVSSAREIFVGLVLVWFGLVWIGGIQCSNYCMDV